MLVKMKKFIIPFKKELPDNRWGSLLQSDTQWWKQKIVAATLSSWCMMTLFGFLVSCNDDQHALEPWEQELDQLRMKVASYQDIENAIEDGYDTEFTGYRTQMGFHYMKASLIDDKFELEKPEVVLYAPDTDGNLQFVAVEYAVPIENMENPPPAPAGFTGEVDVWEINTEFNVWTLHVWVGLDNPHGVFASHNPNLP